MSDTVGACADHVLNSQTLIGTGLSSCYLYITQSLNIRVTRMYFPVVTAVFIPCVVFYFRFYTVVMYFISEMHHDDIGSLLRPTRCMCLPGVKLTAHR